MSGEWGSPATVTGLTAYVVQLLNSICKFRPHILASRADTLRYNFDMITRMRVVDLQADVAMLRKSWNVDLSCFSDKPENLLNAFLGWLHANCKDPCALLADELDSQEQKIRAIAKAFRIQNQFAGLWTSKRGERRRDDEIGNKSASGGKHAHQSLPTYDFEQLPQHGGLQRSSYDEQHSSGINKNAQFMLTDAAEAGSKPRVSNPSSAVHATAAALEIAQIKANSLVSKASLPASISAADIVEEIHFIGGPPPAEDGVEHASKKSTKSSSSSSSSSSASRKPATAVVTSHAKTTNQPNHYTVVTQAKDAPAKDSLRSVSLVDVSINKPSDKVEDKGPKVRPCATWCSQSIFDQSTQGVIPDLPSKTTEACVKQGDLIQPSARRPTTKPAPAAQQPQQAKPAPAAQQPQQPASLSRAPTLRENSMDSSAALQQSNVSLSKAQKRPKHSDQPRGKSRTSSDHPTSSSGSNSTDDSG